MEYFLIFLLQLIGIGFHVGQKLKAMDDKYPDKNIRQLLNTFIDEDWITLCISALVIALNLVTHYIIDTYTPDLRNSVNYYILYTFAIALILGYSGQRIIYKYLGKAEEVLNKKADTIK